ncbi:MAG: ParA family protein [Verrucomicrobia bacterium]|nr:ParA family protein [Verrucomicrobiota bacterium]
MAITVSFVNMKGGVGKTTLAMHAALAADQMGFKVLAVDLDPQSNLSQSLLGAQRYRKHLDANKPTVIQIFEGYLPSGKGTTSPTSLGINDIIQSGVGYSWKSKLDLIPSRFELCNTLRKPDGKERRLAESLATVADRYDLMVIDCAPTDSVLTDAAYFASRYVLIPIKPEFMATIGLPLLAESLKAFRSRNKDHSIDICGIVFVNSSGYSSGPEGRQSVNDVTIVATQEGWPVFTNRVGYSASYAKSGREGRPIARTSHVRNSTVSDFHKFKDEFFNAIGLRKTSP